jgi:hypothetical protein
VFFENLTIEVQDDLDIFGKAVVKLDGGFVVLMIEKLEVGLGLSFVVVRSEIVVVYSVVN